MIRAWRAWVRLWDQREPATALALVRILVGACVLADLLESLRLGLVDAVWAPPPDGMGYGATSSPWVVDWLGVSASTSRLTWAVATVAAALLMVGLATRFAAVVLVLASAQLGYLAPDGQRGIDVALRTVVLVLACSGAHGRWSVDALLRRRLGRPFAPLVPTWPRLLLFAQLLWIYFSSGHNKVSPEWWPGDGFSALTNVLSDPHYARFGDGWLPTLYPFTQAATAVVMLFELSAPLVMVLYWFDGDSERGGRLGRWCRRLRLRWVWIGTGLLLHLGIALSMRLGIFPWGMLALYPVLLRPEELARAETWVRLRVGRRTSGRSLDHTA